MSLNNRFRPKFRGPQNTILLKILINYRVSFFEQASKISSNRSKSPYFDHPISIVWFFSVLLKFHKIISFSKLLLVQRKISLLNVSTTYMVYSGFLYSDCLSDLFCLQLCFALPCNEFLHRCKFIFTLSSWLTKIIKNQDINT